MEKSKKTLSQRVEASSKIIEKIFSKDRVIWGDDNYSKVPKEIVDDPFVSALVKYYNSGYFYEKDLGESATKKIKRSFDFLINRVILPLGRTPDNVLFMFVKEVRNKISNTDNIVWAYYIYLTPPIYILGNFGQGGKKRLPEVLSRIKFSTAERVVTQRICFKKNIPNVKKPEFGSGKDLIEHLDLDVDGQDIILSLRYFSSWYILEWDKIRKSIYKLCPDEVCELNNYILKKPEQRDKRIFSQNIGDHLEINNLIDIIYRIVKAVKHPMLTERFAIGYMCLHKNTNKWYPSDAILDIYNFDSFICKSNEVDFVELIESNYMYSYDSLGANSKKHAGRLIRNKRSLKCPDYYNGSLGQVLSVSELLGITMEEEVCFAWLLASDRHQPSNIARMFPEDIEETTNTLSTVINPQSIKFRSRKVSGTPYVEGEIYNKNGIVFKAIKSYKKQISSSYLKGYFGSEITNETEGPILPRITLGGSEPSLTSAGFRIHKTVKSTMQLLICSMPGSLSYVHASKANNQNMIWLDIMKKSALQSVDISQGKGFKTLACSYVQRQSVNNMLYKSININAIPLSSNNNLAVISEELDFQQRTDAALHNHSVAVRSNIYLDKAPSRITLNSSSRFGARVGDEMIRMCLPLAERLTDSTTAVTIEEARELLGLKTKNEPHTLESTDANAILEQARLQDYVVDEIGITTRHGQSIILKTALTAALIKSKIDHIDNNIEELLTSNETLANNMISHRLYLQLILDEFFSKSEIESAAEQYGGYDFPMNDLLV